MIPITIHLPDSVNNRVRFPFNIFIHDIGKLSKWIFVMKNPKLNLRKFCRFSPGGMDLKYMIGNRMKFHIVHTTHAFVTATSLIEEPIIASLDAKCRF